MSRLTNNVLYFENSQSVNDKKLCVKVFNKLSNLEYLEDELGVPLEVVFKALKVGIVEENDEEYEGENLNLHYIDKQGWFLCPIVCIYDEAEVFYLKDYGKTWWLKENGNEED